MHRTLTRRCLLAGAFASGALPAWAASSAWGAKLAAAARLQVGVTTLYDPAYVQLAYPGGDVPRERGVCTDVLVRAYRDAFGLDLQQLMHEDMARNFAAYPKRWGLSRPNSNIDHRRVPNIQVFLRRHGAEMPISGSAAEHREGDLVSVKLPGNLDHIMIVAGVDPGQPTVIHNIGAGAREEEALFTYPHTGHYRFAPPTQGVAG